VNFYQQFIVNYASYVEPLLVLLRKGNRWKWTTELQQAFEILRAKFGESIYLVRPDEEKSWIISTDASGKAIGSVLMLQNENRDFNIISTASRVLSQLNSDTPLVRRNYLRLSMLYSASRFIFMGAQLSYLQIIKPLPSFTNLSLHSTV
jgi:hypothetical protein